MAIVKGEQAERETVIGVAKAMAVAARTAPKGKGSDHIKTAILTADEKNKLSEKMDELSDVYGFFKRDAKNLRDAEAVLLVGLSAEPMNIDCGACGSNCDEMRHQIKKEGRGYRGPVCIMDILNLGIALGSSAKTASISNVDNRLMFSVGVAARKSGVMSDDVVVGIPLSAKGKNIFFDRRHPCKSSLRP